MGFVFDKKPTIEIDGRLYECDPTDINLIEGVSQHYPKILAIGIEFEEMKKQLLDTRKNAKKIQANNEAFVQKNKELLVECQSFIHGTLGVEEYNEIFANRKPNSVEHLKLCVYIFNEIMKDRAKFVEEYIDLPEVPKGDNDAVNSSAE